jgi:branched-chain amino acid aminotransferase
MKVWIDGGVVEAAQARVPVLDHGLLYGDGVFEGIRICSGRVFRLDAHLRRLADSARALALDLPWSQAALRGIVIETLRAFGRPDAYVRIIVTRGDGPLGVDPTLCAASRLICIAGEIAIHGPEKLARGLDLVTVSVRRAALDALDPRVKSLNYLHSVLAKLEARQRGADEALLLNAAGAVAEASVANVFVWRRGALRTPLTTDGALEGVTRDTLLEIARELDIPAREETLGRHDLLSADEVFLCGTGIGIAPVRSLDGRELPGVLPGPLTSKLALAHRERLQSEGTPF